jgi:hypothetical protein
MSFSNGIVPPLVSRCVLPQCFEVQPLRLG